MTRRHLDDLFCTEKPKSKGMFNTCVCLIEWHKVFDQIVFCDFRMISITLTIRRMLKLLHHETCPCNVWPLNPIIKQNLGMQGYMCIPIFLFLLQNIDCGYSLEPPRRGGSSLEPPRRGGSNVYP